MVLPGEPSDPAGLLLLYEIVCEDIQCKRVAHRKGNMTYRLFCSAFIFLTTLQSVVIGQPYSSSFAYGFWRQENMQKTVIGYCLKNRVGLCVL